MIDISTQVDVRVVVDRTGFDFWPSQTNRLKKLEFTASLLDVQHEKGIVGRQAGKFTCCVLEQDN